MIINKIIRNAEKRMYLNNNRKMASHSNDSKNYPFGMHFHVNPIHKYIGTALGTTMWLWIFWRAKHDGKVLLGLEHPFDHGDHGDHGDHDVSTIKKPKYRYEKESVGANPTLIMDNE